ncbi:hypothetical protein M9Y10_007678 [Tritrichomonas musculus]|uniref:Uncharacterized protein n=1 Tax=Tritrichomonas musculus TaxID=1915356 RepID=A0ABR2J214_9EUKA
MSIESWIDKMKNIQRVFLEYLREESNIEENFENLIQIIKDQQIAEQRYEFKELLHLISKIMNNHKRVNNFLNKIERILQHFKSKITEYFSSTEIFEIFKYNKRLLLFLVEEKIMTFNEYIVSQITKNDFIYQKKYAQYFAPEIRPFITKEFIQKYGKPEFGEINEKNHIGFKTKNSYLTNTSFIKEIIKEKKSDFYEKRKEGENDNYLCKLIRLRQAKAFFVYANKMNLLLTETVPLSVFETNSYLMNENVTYVEYAAFFGSIEIIRCLENIGYELSSNMWLFSIHSDETELIEYLKHKSIKPPKCDYVKVLKESIKCHHNDLSNYIINNFLGRNFISKNEEGLRFEINYYNNIFRCAYAYHNYCFFPKNIKFKYSFYYLCEFDYVKLVKFYLENMNIDVNAVITKKYYKEKILK